MSFFTDNRIGIMTSSVDLVLVAVLWYVSVFVFPQNSPAAVLHYSVGIGIDFIGQGGQIVVLPTIATSILLANTVLGYVVRRASIQSSNILWISSPFVLCILVGAYFYLLRLNV